MSVNSKYHHLVFGYIRLIQESVPYNTNTFYTMPPSLWTIILSYFVILKETWNTKLKSLKIFLDTQNSMICYRSALTNPTGFASIYGNNICEYNNYYHWKFKILQFADNNWAIWLGLTKETKCRKCINGEGFITGNGDGFAWVLTKPADSKSLIQSAVVENSYGKPIENNGDIVDMIFDFHDHPSLSYKVNNNDYGQAKFCSNGQQVNNSFDYRDKYRMGITFKGVPNKVELIEYFQS
eukprot:339191_1